MIYAICLVIIICLCVLGAALILFVITHDTDRVTYDEHTGHYTVEISEAYILTHTPEEVGDYMYKLIRDYEFEEFEK